MTDLNQVYNEVIAHYLACDVGSYGTNEIWPTRSTKGSVYSREELMQALSPGNRVCDEIYDFAVYFDPTGLDLEDPVTRRILEMEESDFGNPIKDIEISGQTFSSKYLSSVVVGTRIIKHLASLSLDYPRVMEIGAGVGHLMQVLKKYYGDNITLFAVDLPETLISQEWLLRNWFPEATHAYKGSSQELSPAEGGINFINSHVLQSQDIPIDVVINICSIQEMDKPTSDDYFAYAGKNLSPGGIFYFENRFGHADNATREPTEHPVDAVFSTVSAEIALQAETLRPYEMFRMVMQKTDQMDNVETRRFIHRLLWNGFNSGLIPHNESLVRKLTLLPRSVVPHQSAQACQSILEDYQVPSRQTDLRCLETSVHFDSELFLRASANRSGQPEKQHQSAHDFIECLWGGQAAIMRLIQEATASSGTWSPSLARDKVRRICSDLLNTTVHPEESEFRTLQLACFLLPLGQKKDARDLLLACADHSQQPYWQIRFAQLLSVFGYYQEASSVLDRITEIHQLIQLGVANIAAIRYTIGETEVAETILGELALEAENISYQELRVFSEACLKLDNLVLAERALELMLTSHEDGFDQHVLELLRSALAVEPEESGRRLVSRFLGQLNTDSSTPKAQMVKGVLLHLVGDTASGRKLMSSSLKSMSEDYYSLGWAGKTLIKAGIDNEGSQCLQRSITLRPPNFMHYEFIGNAYFWSQHWPEASEVFHKALTIVPYARQSRARALFCDLPETYKESKTFSDHRGLALAFHQYQDFDSDILPSFET